MGPPALPHGDEGPRRSGARGKRVMQMRGDATETSIRSPLGVAVNRGGAEKHQPSQLPRR